LIVAQTISSVAKKALEKSSLAPGTFHPGHRSKRNGRFLVASPEEETTFGNKSSNRASLRDSLATLTALEVGPDITVDMGKHNTSSHKAF